MKKWIWMGSDKLSSYQWQERFENIKSHGIDAILLNGNEKLLKQTIPIAVNLGLELHSWYITMLGNGELSEKYPEWFTVNGLGESSAEKPQYVDYYKWLCPNNPDVQQFLLDKIKNLCNIPGNNGIHLDYIRFSDVILPKGIQPNYKLVQTAEEPQYDYCYCKHCRNLFKHKYGIDPLELNNPHNNLQWLKFRYNSISNLVKKIAKLVRKNDKIISAAVFPIQMQKNVRQQWHEWNLDAVFPMMYQSFYNEDTDWIVEETKKGSNLLEETQLISGLYVPAFKKNELEDLVRTLDREGVRGLSYFNYSALNKLFWKL